MTSPAGDAALSPTYWGRRIVAVLIDWLLAYAVSLGFAAGDPWATLGIFAASTFILQASLGTTIGHRLLGIGMRTADGRPPGLARAAVRTLALCAALPAVITDAHGRGLHERWSGTYVVRLGH